MSWKKIIKSVAGITLAALLLWISFKNIDFQTFFTGITKCNWEWIIVAMLFGLFALIIRGVRWSQMIRPIDNSIRFFRAYNAYNVGNLASFALPGTGEFVRSGLISGKSSSYDKILGTVATERIIDALSIIFLTIAIIVLSDGTTANFFESNIIDPFVKSFSLTKLAVLVTIVITTTLFILAVKILSKRVKIFEKIDLFIIGLWRGMKSISKIEHKGRFILFTLLIWACYWMEAEAVVLSLQGIIDISIIDSLFISLLGSISSIIPVPGGIGAYHYLIALAMSSLFGCTWGNGIIFATLLHEPHNFVIVASGLLSSLSLKRRK